MTKEELYTMDITKIPPRDLCEVGGKCLDRNTLEHYNVDRAIQCYEKAEILGNPLGSYELGLLYFNGDHVKLDYKKALEHFSKAANAAQGWKDKALLAQCMYCLGYILFYSKGIERNLYLGIEYMQKAVNLGDPLAIETLPRMKTEIGLFK